MNRLFVLFFTSVAMAVQFISCSSRPVEYIDVGIVNTTSGIVFEVNAKAMEPSEISALLKTLQNKGEQTHIVLSVDPAVPAGELFCFLDAARSAGFDDKKMVIIKWGISGSEKERLGIELGDPDEEFLDIPADGPGKVEVRIIWCPQQGNPPYPLIAAAFGLLAHTACLR